MLRLSRATLFQGWRRYAIALVATAVALLLRHSLQPILGMTNPYHTVWVGVVFCAWFCGVGPTIIATLLMVMGIIYWFLPPVGFGVADPREWFGVAGFLFFAGVVITIGERARRTQAKLNAAHSEMEATVKQRTAELAGANQSLRELSTKLLHMQDAERRRLARDLHDSVGQSLAVIGMNLTVLDRESISSESAQAVEDAKQILQQVTREIRTLSHLLHPPLLEESGLEPALHMYLEGFATRSNMETSLEVSPDLPRVTPELELTVFRIVQESLTNCHKHAEAHRVNVSVQFSGGRIVVQVSDDGKGIRAHQPLGVGLSGMRERARELRGTFEVRSNYHGTTVIATFPTNPSGKKAAAAGAT